MDKTKKLYKKHLLDPKVVSLEEFSTFLNRYGTPKKAVEKLMEYKGPRTCIFKGCSYYIDDEENGDEDLIEATKNGNIELVKELIDAGVDVNLQDEDEETALILASVEGHIEIVKLLIEAGADLNIKSRYGKTALMWTSQYGHTEIVKLLIDAGVDLNIKDIDGKTALDFASDKGHTEIVKLLKGNVGQVAKDSTWYLSCTDQQDPISMESWKEMTENGDINDPVTIQFPNRVECGEREDFQKLIDTSTKFKIWIPNPEAAISRWLRGEDLIDYSGRGGMIAPGNKGVFVKLGYFYVLIDDKPFDNDASSYNAELVNEKPFRIGGVGSSLMEMSATHGNTDALVYRLVPDN